MRFFDKISWGIKLQNVAKLRNENLMARIDRNEAHPIFSLVPIYLGLFFNGIYEDENTKEIFKALANADEQTLDEINKLLAFWFVWSLDRLMNIPLFNERLVQENFREIWSIDSTRLNDLLLQFDSLKNGENTLRIWSMVREKLNNETLSPVFALMHLRNAMVNILQR